MQVNGHSIGNHLHYDDIAFVSYACAIALIAVVLLISMICNDAKESRVPEE